MQLQNVNQGFDGWLKINNFPGVTRNSCSLYRLGRFSNTGKKRWAVEDMHRGVKQLCGLEKSYIRKARAKNHIFCSMRVFVLLKIAQAELNISIYQQKWGIVKDSVGNFLAIRCFA